MYAKIMNDEKSKSISCFHIFLFYFVTGLCVRLSRYPSSRHHNHLILMKSCGAGHSARYTMWRSAVPHFNLQTIKLLRSISVHIIICLAAFCAFYFMCFCFKTCFNSWFCSALRGRAFFFGLFDFFVKLWLDGAKACSRCYKFE